MLTATDAATQAQLDEITTLFENQFAVLQDADSAIKRAAAAYELSGRHNMEAAVGIVRQYLFAGETWKEFTRRGRLYVEIDGIEVEALNALDLAVAALKLAYLGQLSSTRAAALEHLATRARASRATGMVRRCDEVDDLRVFGVAV